MLRYSCAYSFQNVCAFVPFIRANIEQFRREGVAGRSSNWSTRTTSCFLGVHKTRSRGDGGSSSCGSPSDSGVGESPPSHSPHIKGSFMKTRALFLFVVCLTAALAFGQTWLPQNWTPERRQQVY